MLEKYNPFKIESLSSFKYDEYIDMFSREYKIPYMLKNKNYKKKIFLKNGDTIRTKKFTIHWKR